MNYKRTCRDCGGTIRYTEEDKYIVCPFCGRKTPNPHYEEIEYIDDDDFIEEVPVRRAPAKKAQVKKGKQNFFEKLKSNKKAFIATIASISAVVLIGLIVLISFAVPKTVEKVDAKKTYTQVIKDTVSADKGTVHFMVDADGRDDDDDRHVESWVYFEKDKYAYVKTVSDEYTSEAFLDCENGKIFYSYQTTKQSIKQYATNTKKEALDEFEEFEEEYSDYINFAEDFMSASDIWTTFEKAYKQWGNTTIQFMDKDETATIVLGSKYLKSIELVQEESDTIFTYNVEFKHSSKKPKFSESDFKKVDWGDLT